MACDYTCGCGDHCCTCNPWLTLEPRPCINRSNYLPMVITAGRALVGTQLSCTPVVRSTTVPPPFVSKPRLHDTWGQTCDCDCKHW